MDVHLNWMYTETILFYILLYFLGTESISLLEYLVFVFKQVKCEVGCVR